MEQSVLPRRRLGRARIEVSCLGVGTGSIGLSRDRDTSEPERAATAVATVGRAVELGIDFFDTSPLYQAEVAERSLGAALAELPPAARKRVKVSTKAGTRPGMQGQYDRDSILRTTELIGQAAGAADLGRLELEPHWDEPWWGATTSWHQVGTTRMSEGPTDGVVDPDCLVHGTRNLYVAGGSVMPTAGRANPTLTIVALTIRLADHLKAIERS